jgi:hypothetical protein
MALRSLKDTVTVRDSESRSQIWSPKEKTRSQAGTVGLRHKFVSLSQWLITESDWWHFQSCQENRSIFPARGSESRSPVQVCMSHSLCTIYIHILFCHGVAGSELERLSTVFISSLPIGYWTLLKTVQQHKTVAGWPSIIFAGRGESKLVTSETLLKFSGSENTMPNHESEKKARKQSSHTLSALITFKSRARCRFRQSRSQCTGFFAPCVWYINSIVWICATNYSGGHCHCNHSSWVRRYVPY